MARCAGTLLDSRGECRPLDESKRMIRVLTARLKNKAQYARKKESFTFDVAFAVYCKSRGDGVVLETFFGQQPVPHEPSGAYSIWKDALERRYLDTDPEEIAQIIDGESAHLPHRASRRASKWLLEYDLYKWVLQKNTQQGVAPSYGSLLRAREALCPHDESSAEPLAASCVARASSRWRARIRRIWRLETGTLPPQQAIPVAMARQKAKTRRCEKMKK